MKIAFFSDTHTPQVNGVTRTIERLKSAMDQEGIEYQFFVPTAGRERTNNIFSHFHLSLFLYPECKIALPLYPKIKKKLDAFKPDLIHVITPFTLGYMGCKYAGEHGLPLVASYHTNFSDYLPYYHLEGLEPFYWKYFRWFHSQTALNLCPSMDTLKILEHQGIGNLKIWDRGIDTEKFSPSHRSDKLRQNLAPKGEKLLLYVGRISIEKEIECLIRASNILTEKGVLHRLLIVGEGPHLHRLKQISSPQTTFLGYLSGKTLQEMYASADLFLFASPTETYGNVILEAMASGLPVIAVNQGGVTENLVSGYNGFAVNRGDGGQMAQLTEKLLQNPDLYHRVQKNALAHAGERRWELVFKNLFRNYREAAYQKAIA